MMKTKDRDIILQEQLIELESTPKTRMQIVTDYIICFLPVACIVISIAEYLGMSDVVLNAMPMTYIYVLIIFLVIYFFWSIFSICRKDKMRSVRYKAPLYCVTVLVLTGYDILTLKSGILPMPFFPCINQILNAIIKDWEYLFECTMSTLRLLLHGYSMGVVAGLVTGVAAGYSKRINYWISPIMRLIGPVPTTTWIPVIMVLASSLYKGSVFVIALGVWYSVALATITGVSNVEKSYFEAARTLGAKERHLILRVAIPSAVPSMFQGLTQGMTIACTTLLVAEMMGTESGLGWYINWQKSWAMYANMYAAIVLICVIFTLVTYVLAKIRKFCTRWQEGVVK